MKWTMGMMSGTSMDGVDVALLRTDGVTVSDIGPFASYAYTDADRGLIASVLGGVGDTVAAETCITDRHIQAVQRFLADQMLQPEEIDAIGFHGQTILHLPDQGRTWQLGDGQKLADAVGIDVVCDLRKPDMAAGGQGAPLAPLYHAARANDAMRPLAVLNLGGVGNVTWIGQDGTLIGFDTGPANALLDDWIFRHTGARMDTDGRIAAAGRSDTVLLAALMAAPYFRQPPPKSLDRQDFANHTAGRIAARYPTSPPFETVARTLVEFTAETVAAARAYFPEAPQIWMVTGGGRHNPTLMAALAGLLTPAKVCAVEDAGWRGDALEAEAFAYLAKRSRMGLPLSAPSVTGASKAASGGAWYKPGTA